ncbi:hypothetical protein PFISCL1PPCAC_28656, partial [Pristionchus fissidentatus]
IVVSVLAVVVLYAVAGEIVETPSSPGPLPASSAASKKKSRWPCNSGCGLGYYGLSGSGLGGYSPYLGGGLGSVFSRNFCSMTPALGGIGGGCMDLSPQCATYAATGQCATNPFLIRRLCPLSCGTGCTGFGTGLGTGVGGIGGLGGLGTYGGYNPVLTGGVLPGAYGTGLYGNALGGYGTGLGGYGAGLYGNGLYGNAMGGAGLGRSIYETGIYRKPNESPVTSIKAISDAVKANTPVASLPALPKRFQ